jgi:hypothetical protein
MMCDTEHIINILEDTIEKLKNEGSVTDTELRSVDSVDSEIVSQIDDLVEIVALEEKLSTTQYLNKIESLRRHSIERIFPQTVTYQNVLKHLNNDELLKIFKVNYQNRYIAKLKKTSVIDNIYLYLVPMQILFCKIQDNILRLRQVRDFLKIFGHATPFYINLSYSILSMLCRPSVDKALDVGKKIKKIVDIEPLPKVEPGRKYDLKTIIKSVKRNIVDLVVDAINDNNLSFNNKFGLGALLTSILTMKVTGLPMFRYYNVAEMYVKGPGVQNLLPDDARKLKKRIWAEIGELKNVENKFAKFSELYRAAKMKSLAVSDGGKSFINSLLDNDIVKTGNKLTIRASPGTVCLTVAAFYYMFYPGFNDYMKSIFADETIQSGGGFPQEIKANTLFNEKIIDDLSLDVWCKKFDSFYENVIMKALTLYLTIPPDSPNKEASVFPLNISIDTIFETEDIQLGTEKPRNNQLPIQIIDYDQPSSGGSANNMTKGARNRRNRM